MKILKVNLISGVLSLGNKTTLDAQQMRIELSPKGDFLIVNDEICIPLSNVLSIVKERKKEVVPPKLKVIA